MGIGLMAGAKASQAATSLEVTPLAQKNVYAGQFDVLVYDFNLKTDQMDFLQAMTINQTGYIQMEWELSKVILWQDEGPSGFQGMGIDARLGKGVATSNGFAWQKLNVDIQPGDNHFFVSIETTDRRFSSKRTLYFSLPDMHDVNGDGIYQDGDAGIFLNSKAKFPVGQSVMNQFSVVTSTADTFAPKMTLTSNHSEDYNEFWMGGDIREDGRSGLNSAEIQITPVGGETGVWAPVIYGTRAWIYRASLEDGEYLVSWRATDGNGNQVVGEPITLTVKAK